ncbi:MAG: hypothetical protein QN178_09370 [Armatimonadota bacterium]|nr:hypothetical protein [Armatimonadota bacterium]
MMGVRVAPAGSVAISLVVIVAVISFGVSQALGQGSHDIEICKKVESRGHVYGSELVARQCVNRLTTADAYVAIIFHLKNFTDSMTVGVEVLDPDQAAVWSATYPIRVEAGRGYSSYWIWRVLPIAADEAALAAENPQLAAARLRIEGRPVKERLGEWTVRMRINNGWPLTRKFTLAAQ